MSRARNFGQFARVLRELSRVPSRVAVVAAPKIRRLITEQFTREQDPYGAAWAPLTESSLRRGRRPPVLTDTRRMRGGVRVQPMVGAGLSVTIPAPYAGFHQTGTQHMVARPIYPRAGMPPRWRAAIERAFRAALGAHMGGAR